MKKEYTKSWMTVFIIFFLREIFFLQNGSQKIIILE